MPKKILVVEDDRASRTMLSKILIKYGHQAAEANNGVQALEKIQKVNPDLIFMDINMPMKDGITTLAEIRQSETFSDIPVIMLTARSDKKTVAKAIELGAVDFLVKPFDTKIVLKKVESFGNAKIEKSWENLKPIQQKMLRLSVASMQNSLKCVEDGKPLPYGEIKETCSYLVESVVEGDVQCLLDAVHDHDNGTFVHSLRVAAILGSFANFKGLGKQDTLEVVTGGMLHDMGKSKIPLTVLNKPGRLTEDEFKIMRKHAEYTMEILRQSPGITPNMVEIGGRHHERMDGTGYPRGLKGEDIGTLGAMAAITDAFEALTAKRPYKNPIPGDESLKIMKSWDGHLDPVLLSQFSDLIHKGL
jgi:putative nucleotidyltransferase with HDIG domain